MFENTRFIHICIKKLSRNLNPEKKPAVSHLFQNYKGIQYLVKHITLQRRPKGARNAFDNQNTQLNALNFT